MCLFCQQHSGRGKDSRQNVQFIRLETDYVIYVVGHCVTVAKVRDLSRPCIQRRAAFVLMMYSHLYDEARRFVGHVHNRCTVVFGGSFASVSVHFVEVMSM